MTRFDATEPADRQQLYADAITAHRERGSGYLTLEVDTELLKTGETDADGSESDGDDSSTHTFDQNLASPGYNSATERSISTARPTNSRNSKRFSRSLQRLQSMISFVPMISTASMFESAQTPTRTELHSSLRRCSVRYTASPRTAASG